MEKTGRTANVWAAVVLSGILAMGMPGQAQAAKADEAFSAASGVATDHGALRVEGAGLVDARVEK